MYRKLMKFSALSAFALMLVAYGCDTVSESALTGPGEKSEILIIERDESGYTVARETDPAVGVVTAIIDRNGGTLNIGNHVLTVPVGAVDGPTTFTMTKLVDEIEVGLTATRLLPNDVGHAGSSAGTLTVFRSPGVARAIATSKAVCPGALATTR